MTHLRRHTCLGQGQTLAWLRRRHRAQSKIEGRAGEDSSAEGERPLRWDEPARIPSGVEQRVFADGEHDQGLVHTAIRGHRELPRGYHHPD